MASDLDGVQWTPRNGEGSTVVVHHADSTHWYTLEQTESGQLTPAITQHSAQWRLCGRRIIRDRSVKSSVASNENCFRHDLAMANHLSREQSASLSEEGKSASQIVTILESEGGRTSRHCQKVGKSLRNQPLTKDAVIYTSIIAYEYEYSRTNYIELIACSTRFNGKVILISTVGIV